VIFSGNGVSAAFYFILTVPMSDKRRSSPQMNPSNSELTNSGLYPNLDAVLLSP
jgi:hypothetical protein